MENLRLISAVYSAMIKHAYAALPSEAVGLLGGYVPGYATISIALPNHISQKAFLADPYQQYKAERHLADLGLQLIAIYHSHPGGGTQLSQLDMMYARKRNCFQIVIALERVHMPGEELCTYQIQDNKAVMVAMQIVA